jgi:hypothetical protein
MWKELLATGISTLFNYFHTKEVCENNFSELTTLSILNLIMTCVTLCTLVFKKPIKVIDNRVDFT